MHYSADELILCLAMILFVYTLIPHYEASGPFACSLVTETLPANSCLLEWTWWLSRCFLPAFATKHCPCINLCALMCVRVCTPFITTEAPPPPPARPSPSPAHNSDSTHHSLTIISKKHTKTYQFFVQPVASNNHGSGQRASPKGENPCVSFHD